VSTLFRFYDESISLILRLRAQSFISGREHYFAFHDDSNSVFLNMRTLIFNN
jgi:hypothetical protein